MHSQTEQTVSYLGQVQERPQETEPSTTKELNAELSGEARVWAALEKLSKENPSSAEEALSQAMLLIRHAGSPTGREAIMRALRTEKPEQFAFDEVRVSAFRALSPHLTEADIALVFIEELETYPEHKRSCKAVIEGLNAVPGIKDQSLVNRITEIFLNKHSAVEYKEILSTLAPHFLTSPDDKLSFELEKIAKESYLRGEAPPAAVLTAVALTPSYRSAFLLREMATQTLNKPYSPLDPYKKGWEIFGPNIFAPTLLFSILSWPVFHSPIGVAATFIGTQLAPAIIGYFVGKTERKITNIDGAAAAARVLRYCGWNEDVKESLIKLSADTKLPASILGAAKESLMALRPTNSIDNLISMLTHPSPDIRLVSLRELTHFKGEKVVGAVTKLTKDREQAVRNLAYEVLDKVRQ